MALGEKGGGRGEGGREGGGEKGRDGRLKRGCGGGGWEGRRVLAGLTEVHSSSELEPTESWHWGGDTAHKSETITACRHTHKHTHRCDHTVCVHTHTYTSCVHCGLSHLRETALPPPVLPHPSLPVSLLFLLHPLFWSVGLIEDAL